MPDVATPQIWIVVSATMMACCVIQTDRSMAGTEMAVQTGGG